MSGKLNAIGLSIAVLCLTACGADQTTIKTPEASEAAPATAPKGPSLGDIMKRVESDEPPPEVDSGEDPAVKNMSPFRGIYTSDQRDVYEAAFQEIRDQPGQREFWLEQAETSLKGLNLNLKMQSYLRAMQCASAYETRGRQGEGKLFDAQYASKFWINALFVQLDSRNPGSVGGFPEQVPGIERFPDKKRDFTPEPGVEPYRKQAFINYRFIQEDDRKPEGRKAALDRAKSCDGSLPPEVGQYE